MTDEELNKKVEELRKLKEIAVQLENVIENIKDEIKSEMTVRDTDNLHGIDWKITWREYTSRRLDTQKLEEKLGDLSPYKKIVKYKSFYLRDK